MRKLRRVFTAAACWIAPAITPLPAFAETVFDYPTRPPSSETLGRIINTPSSGPVTSEYRGRIKGNFNPDSFGGTKHFPDVQACRTFLETLHDHYEGEISGSCGSGSYIAVYSGNIIEPGSFYHFSATKTFPDREKCAVFLKDYKKDNVSEFKGTCAPEHRESLYLPPRLRGL